ncbi:MAG TPA: bifunctional hydroxymethylpyrimidine kinase/phosphomethylpyrimidine kinase [Thermoplasmata archaeon]|nr:bifunctional hydroxymethylpyrimidine kinase/phosphomethylpyrimidine kinase [Thermoplasmata archaeon]
MKKIALSIAGSDSSGGAGIQADIKAFTHVGVHGTTIITSVTAQHPGEVLSIYPLSTDEIKKQAKAVFPNLKPHATKIGMLYNKEIAECIAGLLEGYGVENVVLDPVLSSTSGYVLYKKGLTETILEKLLPITYLVTPNTSEAEQLTGIKITNIDDMKQAAKQLVEEGAKNVLIKGGHLRGKQAIDFLFDGNEETIFSLPRFNQNGWHGTGCTLSSLITAHLAQGNQLKTSIELSKSSLWGMMKNSYRINKTLLLETSKDVEIDVPPPRLTPEQFQVWFELNKTVHQLLHILPKNLIPEVGINIGYALPDAENRNQVCALDGRIIRGKQRFYHGILRFGVSKHISSIILTTMKFNKNMRSAMNIKYTPELMEKIKETGLTVCSFSREEEPEEVESTMKWGTTFVIRKHGEVPDVIWDKGSVGKEPMIRLLGKTPEDLIKKLKLITG